MGKQLCNRDMKAMWNDIWDSDQRAEILCQAGITVSYATKRWSDIEDIYKPRIKAAAKDLRYIQ